MRPLVVEMIPLCPAVRCDAPTVVDVLIKIAAPQPDADLERPRLNLALVVDRSGSMSGHRKIDYARSAAVFAVQQLLETDRVSLTIFDDKIETPIPNGPAIDKAKLVEAINRIAPRGSTDLHGGWAEGARQSALGLIDGGINRVLTLSDGLANVGVTGQDEIATAVNQAARTGVSTTTLGLGDDYNEDLLEAMARSGDGNYYYIEHPTQLPTVFANELRGLVASFGTAVTLSVEPIGIAGMAVEALNEFERQPDGRWSLPNLIVGLPVYALMRLNVPARTPQSHDIARFVIEWQPIGETERRRFELTLSLPAVTSSAFDSLAPNVDVLERSVLLDVARLKKEATHLMNRGDKAGATAKIAEARAILAAAPPTDAIVRETAALAELEVDLEQGSDLKFMKRAKYQSHATRYSRPIDTEL